MLKFASIILGTFLALFVANRFFPEDPEDTYLLVRYLVILLAILMVSARMLFKIGNRQSLLVILMVFGQIYLILVAGFAGLYRKTGIVISGEDWLPPEAFDYVYFAIITITSLGYGDVAPTPESRPIVVANVCVGLVVNALFVSVLFRAVSGGTKVVVVEQEKPSYARPDF